MIKTLKDYSIHIGIATLIALVVWALATGRLAGNWESKVLANEKDIGDNKLSIISIEKKIEVVPVLKMQYIELKEDIGELKNGQLEMAGDIKELLKRKN